MLSRTTVRRVLAALTGCVVASVAAVAPLAASAVDRNLGADVPKPALHGEPWSAGAVSRLGSDLDALHAGAPTLHGAHVGLLVSDTNSGAVVYERRADDAFQPASTFKLLTGSAALALLGPEHRFHTEALFDGAGLTIRVAAIRCCAQRTSMRSRSRCEPAECARFGRAFGSIHRCSKRHRIRPAGAGTIFRTTTRPSSLPRPSRKTSSTSAFSPGAAPGAPVTIDAEPEFPGRNIPRPGKSSRNSIEQP